MTTATDLGSPLTGEAIEMVLVRHNAALHWRVGPSDTKIYRPRDGQAFGSAGRVEVQGQQDRFLRIDASHTVTIQELAEVRVADDGTVTQPDSLLIRDSLLHRRPDPEPPPVINPEPPPEPVPVPLGDLAVSAVLQNHNWRVPAVLREPHRGAASRASAELFLPPVVLLYRTSDGSPCGSAASAPPGQSIDHLLQVSDRYYLTEADLRRVRVDRRTGRVLVQPGDPS